MRSRIRATTIVPLFLLLAAFAALVQCGGDSGAGTAGPDDPGSTAARVDLFITVEEDVFFDGLRVAVRYPNGRVSLLSGRGTGIASDFEVTSFVDSSNEVTMTALGQTPADGPGDAGRFTFSQSAGANVGLSEFDLLLCLISEPGLGFRPATSCSMRLADVPPDGVAELDCSSPPNAIVGEIHDFTAFLTIDGLSPPDGSEVLFSLSPGGVGTIAPTSDGTKDGVASTQFLPSLSGVNALLTARTPDGSASCSVLVSVSDTPCPDLDGDGFTDLRCGGDDCDDSDGQVRPGIVEEDCNDDIDNDCDGTLDAFDSDCPPCADTDGDGFPDEGCGGNDCNDFDPGTNPLAAELCDDRKDNDCNGLTDLADPACQGCLDRDGDGFTDSVCGGADCDDENADVSPASPEVCDDGVDNDCDGLFDLADLDCSGCEDRDQDGFLDGACGGSDCDDRQPATNPAAVEDCEDGRDNDCDGLVDGNDPDCFDCDDLDGDGFSDIACGGSDCDDRNSRIHPAASESCTDNIDNNCNNLIDCEEGICGGRACGEDGFSCTDQTCIGGACTSVPIDARCGVDDGIFCNGPTLCDPADPRALPSGCLPVGDPCLDPGSVCDEVGDRCAELDCADGRDNDTDGFADCDDPDCNGRSCQSDGILCTQDVCLSGVCASLPDDGACDDGDFCNGFSSCSPLDPTSGADGCTPHADPCPAAGEGCDEQADICTEEDCSDGSDNDGDGDVDCFDSDCICTEIDCADGVDNDGDGLLDCADPECEARSCNDGIGCTEDICSAGVCVGTPENSNCADLAFCTGTESCDPANPGADPNGCISSGDPCTGGGTVCDEDADRCIELDCADGVDNDGDNATDCADADCDGVSCDDGALCTSNDVCSNRFCIGEPNDLVCSNGLFCDGAESCDPFAPGADAVGCIDSPDPCLPAPDQWCNDSTDECRACDEDQDTFLAEECGGTDCNDEDVTIRPGAFEDCDDGIDNDCDGDVDRDDSTCP